MSVWRPSPNEERWLEVAARLRGTLAANLATERTGGWRSAGLFARIALFVLGLMAAGLTVLVLGFNDNAVLVVAGVVAAGAAEWLKVGKRLHASGIEEGLCVGGYLLIAFWIAEQARPVFGGLQFDFMWLVIIGATAAAGVRLLNPLLTTCAALAFVEWLDTTLVAHAIDATAGAGTTAIVVACVLAAGALAAGAREFRRPSRDRMFDWIVAVVPVYAYARHVNWSSFAMTPGIPTGALGRLAPIALLAGFGGAALIAGLRRRRHAPLLAFLGCIACIGVELRLLLGGPLEVRLVLDGLAAIAAGIVVDRYLRHPRNGLTSEKLTDREGPLDLLQTAGAAVLTQSGSPGAQPAQSAPAQHEGRFGGGGASGRF